MSAPMNGDEFLASAGLLSCVERRVQGVDVQRDHGPEPVAGSEGPGSAAAPSDLGAILTARADAGSAVGCNGGAP